MIGQIQSREFEQSPFQLRTSETFDYRTTSRPKHGGNASPDTAGINIIPEPPLPQCIDYFVDYIPRGEHDFSNHGR